MGFQKHVFKQVIICPMKKRAVFGDFRIFWWLMLDCQEAKHWKCIIPVRWWWWGWRLATHYWRRLQNHIPDWLILDRTIQEKKCSAATTHFNKGRPSELQKTSGYSRMLQKNHAIWTCFRLVIDLITLTFPRSANFPKVRLVNHLATNNLWELFY